MSERFDAVVRASSVLINGGFVPAELGIRDGRIAEILPAGSLATGLIEVDISADEVLLPGLVDTHVHVNEPGRTEWEGFTSATRAAAAGGVTTLIDMPLNSVPATVTAEALQIKRDVALPQAAVNVGFWGGAVPDNLGTLASLHEAGVFGFKAFLAPSGVDEFPHLSTEQLYAALAEIAELGSVLIVHAEDPGVLDANANSGGASYGRFVQSRPPQAETTAIEHVIEGVRRTGARAHILHLSSAHALPALSAARAEGLPITVETCPHYLTLAEEHIPDGATQFKCCPPIRDEGNRDLLWGGLIDGTIDMIVSDHSPSTRELKLGSGGDFGAAWGGIAGLQVGLSAVWTEAARRGVPLASVVRWMSSAPASFAGLDEKGEIRVGAGADLAVFSPRRPFEVRVERLFHKNLVSAYDRLQLTGRVESTWLAGRPIGSADSPRGRLLRGNTPVT